MLGMQGQPALQAEVNKELDVPGPHKKSVNRKRGPFVKRLQEVLLQAAGGKPSCFTTVREEAKVNATA